MIFQINFKHQRQFSLVQDNKNQQCWCWQDSCTVQIEDLASWYCEDGVACQHLGMDDSIFGLHCQRLIWYTALLCTDRFHFLLCLELVILPNIHSYLLSFPLLLFDWWTCVLVIQKSLKMRQYLFGSIFLRAHSLSTQLLLNIKHPILFPQRITFCRSKTVRSSILALTVSEGSVHLDKNLQIDLRSKCTLQQ